MAEASPLPNTDAAPHQGLVPPPLKIIPTCSNNFCGKLAPGYELPQLQCELIEKLGGGSYGEVWLVKLISNGDRYVVKIYDKRREYQRAAHRECKVLHQLRDTPGVINMLANCKANTGCCEHICILMPFFPMSLCDFIEKSHVPPKISEGLQTQIRSLLQALQAIHVKKILHADLKPENILIDATGTIAICDFGSACFTDGLHQELMTSPAYRAPELMPEPHDELVLQYSTASDVWALGCLLVELVTGKLLFNEGGDKAVRKVQTNMISNIQKEFAALYVPSEVDELVSFFTPFFQLKPDERGKIETILNHSFLRGSASSAAVDDSLASSAAVSKKRRITGAEPIAKTSRIHDLLHGTSTSPVSFRLCPFAQLMGTPPFMRKILDEFLSNKYL